MARIRQVLEEPFATHVLLRSPWEEDHSNHRFMQSRLWCEIDPDDAKPPVRTRAELIAELLGWAVDGVDDLQDVEEMPLDRNSSEMTYCCLLDFTNYVSSDDAARIMREHGTLQFRVDLNFFDSVHHDGWTR